MVDLAAAREKWHRSPPVPANQIGAGTARQAINNPDPIQTQETTRMRPWTEQAENDTLFASLHSLEEALAVAPDHGNMHVLAELRSLEEALNQHKDAAEGAYREIDGTRSTF